MSTSLDKLTNETFIRFIRENEQADLTKLLLASNKPNIDIKLAVDQILSRRKSKGKLALWLSQEGLIFPPPLSIEQASSDLTAAYKSELLRGDLLVDLTGGMGVDTLAFATTFNRVIYVEQDPWLCEVFEYNSNKLGLHNISIINQRSEDYLKTIDAKATFYIDPARRGNFKQKVFRFEDCTPDLTKLLFLLKEKTERLLVKASPMIDVTEGIRGLKHVDLVHILSIKNDCKEVLFDLRFSDVNNNPSIKTINYTDQGIESFTFDLIQPKIDLTRFSEPKSYLYEPNASVLKAGGFASICASFPVSKIQQNTHLFTSDSLIQEFPGRKFIVLKDGITKADMEKLLPEKKANIITRNYPLKPEEIKKKYKLKDGGDQYLIGYRNMENKAKLLVAQRLN
ncbi:MAG: SAM-dependent methyltransferase [Cyclobacteriaceae bacterium]